jgi:drug/metabolite transporter (DMT)-like permease
VFEGPIASVKHKIDLALKSTVGGIVALVTAVVAIGFFCAAAFMWLERKLDPIAAALIIGGFFLLLSLIAVLVVVLVQRKPPPPPPPRHKSLWTDPALLATALDIGRTLGPKRAATAVLIGAFLIGMMINRPPTKPEQ